MLTKFLPVGNIPSDPLEASRRRVAIAIYLFAGFLLLGFSGFALIGVKADLSLTFLGNVISLAMGSITLICAWIAYRYNVNRSVLTFVSALLFISLGVPLYANGVGLQAGIIVLVIVTALTINTLPRQLYQRVIFGTIFIQGCVIAADLYLPSFGIPELESPWINPFLAIIILVFGFYALRQFPSYPFADKISTLFVVVAVLTISVLAFGLSTIGTRDLTQQAGFTVLQLVDRLAETVGEKFATEVRILQVAGIQFEEVTTESNATYEGKSPSVIFDELSAIDATWQASTDEAEIIQTVLNSDTSRELREFQIIYPEHFEVFLTDRYGTLLAATNRTSDFYQADEGWWQAAYNNGNGAIYISQPEFDESSNLTGILMAVPIYDDGEVVGILRSTLNPAILVKIFEEEKIEEVGHADLRISRNQLLGTEVLSEEEINALNTLPNGLFGEITFEGEPNFVAQRQIESPAGDIAAQAISNLGWSVIVHEKSEEALSAVNNQNRTTIALSVFALGLAIALGFYASRLLSAPIVNLTKIAHQLAQGNLLVRAELNTQDEISALGEAFNQMARQLDETFKGLEERIAERTTDLNSGRIQSEDRAKNLQAIADISRTISGEQQLDILLPLITRLVSEKFDFYHTGIFLEDESRRFVVLQAANSDGGRRMLNRGHRLEHGQGLVGTVAQTGQPRIALDVGTDAVFFNNPDLPATRSEISLPLIVRGETMGVLDVQSTQPGAFDQNDLNILSVLADQVAIAIENARLFERNQQSIVELQTLYNQFLKKEWSALRGRNTSVGYQQSVAGGKPLRTLVQSDEIRSVLAKGETQVVAGNGSAGESPTVTVPIKLRGETIGVLNVKAPDDGKNWTPDELNLIESVTERLALALESARLLEGTNRRAERERLVAEITGKIRSVNDPQTMIQTAMNELQNALGASRVQVIPEPDKGKPSS